MRPFRPSSDDISRRIVARVMALPEEEVSDSLRGVLGAFADRHVQVEDTFRTRYEQLKIHLEPGATPSADRQLLLGAYFTNEYSIESAALFNPSIVPHPDQSGLAEGSLRFILSLRATGEGHISSITFRTGVLNRDQRISLVPDVPFVMEPERVSTVAYAKALFTHRLEESGVQNEFCRRVLDKLAGLGLLDDARFAEGRARSPPRPGPPTARTSAEWPRGTGRSRHPRQRPRRKGRRYPPHRPPDGPFGAASAPSPPHAWRRVPYPSRAAPRRDRGGRW
jgi:hypothetical protein